MRRLLAAFAVCVAGAQQVSPAFEVASVKVSESATTAMSGMVGFRRGALAVRNVTLTKLIELAYGVEEYRITGGPGWITTERYNINAKPPAPVGEPVARLMLQALLAERFGLRLHRTTTMLAGYTLVAEKGESKLRRDVTEHEGFQLMGAGEIRGPGTMYMLIHALKAGLGVPIEDGTGLTGKYDIALKWQPDDAAPNGEPGASIFAALKEQLGLSLKAGKVPVEVFVIDHAEKRPTEN